VYILQQDSQDTGGEVNVDKTKCAETIRNRTR
jgi:hypothetical protein